MKFIKGYLAVNFLVIAFIGVLQYIETSDPRNLIGSVIGILISILLFRSSFKKSSKSKKQQQEKPAQSDDSIHISLSHVHGLPLTENALCEIITYPDNIKFKSGTTEINLARNKITDMCFKTDAEIQEQAVSSAGGAVAGAMMFGPLGAMIGGRAKTKKVIKTTQYLIITYLNQQGEISFIGFDSTYNFRSARKLVDEFRKLNTTSGIRIDL